MGEAITKEQVEELAKGIADSEDILQFLADSVGAFVLNWDVMNLDEKRKTVYNLLAQEAVVKYQLAIVYSDFNDDYKSVKEYIDRLNARLKELKAKPANQ